MGLDINVKKPTKFLGTEYNEELLDTLDDWTCVYTLDFAPIKHLTKFREGYWETERCGEASFRMSYGSFSYGFREKICQAIHGKSYDDFIKAMNNGDIALDAPFIEMLWFADNEGSFDYVIAEKLLKDFRESKDRILPLMDDYLKQSYADYTELLEECVKAKGVVFYH